MADLSAWLATDEGLAACRSLHIRPEKALSAAAVLAAHADHRTGRNCAVSNAMAAAAAGCSPRTITTVRALLQRSGLAVEMRRGTGSAMTPSHRRRASIWHLVSRRAPVDSSPLCDLPPSRRDRRLSHVGNNSPKGRTRPPSTRSAPPNKPHCSRRLTPRPLHVQRLAAGIAARSLGLDKGHIGRLCEALTLSPLELEAWTARQIIDALNSDMKATNGSWPDRIQNPGGFLLHRLQRLPVRPETTTAVAATAAPEAAAPAAAPLARVPASAEARSQAKAFFAAHRQRVRQKWRDAPTCEQTQSS